MALLAPLLAPPYDAEKTSSEQLTENFRLPPGLQTTITRSSLIVGTRGSGKTMFLRRQRHLHPGVALYGDLRKILNPITSDTGAAGLTFDLNPNLESRIRNKASVLLANWAAHQSNERNLDWDWDLFQRVLPSTFRQLDDRKRTAINELYDRVAVASLAEFDGIEASARLDDFLASLATRCSDNARDPLVLLLDRAEEVPYPCLRPVLGLLDQSHPFIAVVACRPGVLGPDFQLHSNTPIPGDHYNIYHLGEAPYAPEWHDFQTATLSAWLPGSIGLISRAERQWIFHISRDSLRVALEVLFNGFDDKGRFELTRSRTQFYRLQNTLLSAVQGKLRKYNSDIPRLLHKIRAKVTKPLTLPLLLELPSRKQGLLAGIRSISDMSRDEKMVHYGLRAGLFTMPHGIPWHPFDEVKAVEVAPLFMWQEGDQWSDTQPIG